MKRGEPLLTPAEVDRELAAVFHPQPPPLPLGGRPTETVSGVALVPTTYGALTGVGVPPAAAAITAAAIAFLPLLVSIAVDRGRRR